MRGSDPAAGGPAPRGSDLGVRVASALVLVPLALASAYVGGWPFAVFWAIAAAGVLWEWLGLVHGRIDRTGLAIGGLALAVAMLLAGLGRPDGACLVGLAGAGGAAMLAPAGLRAWVAGGIAYAAAMLIALIVLRADAAMGFLVILFLFAVVWATDILAYFVGRTFGGPKLWPAVSPKKTWSGAFGGSLAAVALGVVVAKLGGATRVLPLAAVALVLSVISQFGDLLESAIKRKFGVKDAGHLIPGHGGLMDRLDGFIAAVVAAAIFGVLRGGMDGSARGLLAW